MTQAASEHLGESLGTDFFSVREQFTDEQWSHFSTVRRFVDEEVVPVVGPYWERAKICWPLVKRLPKLGIVGEDIKGYGCGEMSPMACGLVTMELHRGDGSLGVFLGVHAGLAMESIAMCGSEEQKARWLPDMARMNKLGPRADRAGAQRRASAGPRTGCPGARSLGTPAGVLGPPPGAPGAWAALGHATLRLRGGALRGNPRPRHPGLQGAVSVVWPRLLSTSGVSRRRHLERGCQRRYRSPGQPPSTTSWRAKNEYNYLITDAPYSLRMLPVGTGAPAGVPPASQQTQRGSAAPGPARR